MVFRAGRIRQQTDHNAIFYNIDFNTHRLSSGSTNRHWYQTGLKSFDTKSMWLNQNYTIHPDSHEQIEGIKWPNVNEMIECVCQAHEKLCPDVPIIGHFDTKDYTNFCYEWFHTLDV
jgi:hypothetical protein